MQPVQIASLVFLAVFGGVLLGMYVRTFLPSHHLGSDTQQVMQLGMGLVGILTALILALITGSAKSTFDKKSDEFKQSAVNIMAINRTLVAYGPETLEIRQLLRRGIARRLEFTWPQEKFRAAAVHVFAIEAAPDQLALLISQLVPQNDLLLGLQSQALAIINDTVKTRWLLEGFTESAIPLPCLIALLIWLTLIFVSYGLFAPANATENTVQLVRAAPVAASEFLVLELNTPFSGLMKASGEPLRCAISQLGP